MKHVPLFGVDKVLISSQKVSTVFLTSACLFMAATAFSFPGGEGEGETTAEKNVEQREDALRNSDVRESASSQQVLDAGLSSSTSTASADKEDLRQQEMAEKGAQLKVQVARIKARGSRPRVVPMTPEQRQSTHEEVAAIQKSCEKVLDSVGRAVVLKNIEPSTVERFKREIEALIEGSRTILKRQRGEAAAAPQDYGVATPARRLFQDTGTPFITTQTPVTEMPSTARSFFVSHALESTPATEVVNLSDAFDGAEQEEQPVDNQSINLTRQEFVNLLSRDIEDLENQKDFSALVTFARILRDKHLSLLESGSDEGNEPTYLIKLTSLDKDEVEMPEQNMTELKIDQLYYNSIKEKLEEALEYQKIGDNDKKKLCEFAASFLIFHSGFWLIEVTKAKPSADSVRSAAARGAADAEMRAASNAEFRRSCLQAFGQSFVRTAAVSAVIAIVYKLYIQSLNQTSSQ